MKYILKIALILLIIYSLVVHIFKTVFEFFNKS